MEGMGDGGRVRAVVTTEAQYLAQALDATKGGS